MLIDYDGTLKVSWVEQSANSTLHENHVKPVYYNKNGLECYDVQRASMGLLKYQGYLEGCAQKYLWRWEDKNGKEDLQKAIEYLTKLLETVE